MTFSYRTEREDSPPDVPTIQKQMAIVAWQPGPNRVVQVPSQARLPCPSFLCTSRPDSSAINDVDHALVLPICCPLGMQRMLLTRRAAGHVCSPLAASFACRGGC